MIQQLLPYELEDLRKAGRVPDPSDRVTGCKLTSQNQPAVNTAVKTPEQAAADSSFNSGYTITTMQDCCMPTCAWQNNVSGQNLSVWKVQLVLLLQSGRRTSYRDRRRRNIDGIMQSLGRSAGLAHQDSQNINDIEADEVAHIIARNVFAHS